MFCFSFIVMGIFLSFISSQKVTYNIFDLLISEKRDWIRDGGISDDQIDTKKKIVVFGDSRIACGFSPTVFDSLSSEKTFTVNLAQMYSDARRYYFILDDFINNNYVPDYVVLHPSYKRYYKRAHNGSLKEIIYYSFYASDRNVSIGVNYIFPVTNITFNRILRFFEYYCIDKSKYKNKNNLVTDMINQRGNYFWENKYKRLTKNPKIEAIKIEDVTIDPHGEYMEDIDMFLNLAKEHDIKVIVKAEPHKSDKIVPWASEPEFFNIVAEKYENVIFSSSKKNLYKIEKFFAGSHLNYYGARCYTTDLFQEIKHLLF